MLSKKPLRTLHCKNVGGQDNAHCTFEGLHFAGPFGDSEDNYHLFYDFLRSGKTKASNSITQNTVCQNLPKIP